MAEKYHLVWILYSATTGDIFRIVRDAGVAERAKAPKGGIWSDFLITEVVFKNPSKFVITRRCIEFKRVGQLIGG